MVELNFPFKAFSVNAMSYRDSRFKTAEYKAWHSEVVAYMNAHYAEVLNELNQEFNEWNVVYSVRIEFIYPPEVLFNANGGISSRSFDLSNCEKNIIDIVFRNGMAVDDKHIVELISIKKPGPAHAMNLVICSLDKAEYDAMMS